MTSTAKLKGDLFWNYISLMVLGISGLVMNFLVATCFGNQALGVFNQVFAIYIIGSQFAVGGVHYSVLFSVARVDEDPRKRSQTIVSGLLVAAIFGSVLWYIVSQGAAALGSLLGSPEVAVGLAYVAPALLLFSLNKTLLAALNGMEHMKRFAICQATRYIGILCTLIFAAMNAWSAEELPLAFLVAECLVFVLAVVFVSSYICWSRYVISLHAMCGHIAYGLKGFMSGVLVDLNTRVDVLLIGYFLSDELVGRYSLAAILAEGMYQFLVATRNIINPKLARMLKDQDSNGIKSLIRQSWRYIYPAMAALAVAIGIGFYFFLVFVMSDPEAEHSLLLFFLLGGGVWVASGFVAFDGILLQAGKPGVHTMMMISVVLTNVALNLLLIPTFGIVGAATATMIATASVIVYLSFLTKKHLGFSIM